MARDNPSNPYTQDPQHTLKDVPMPVQKARVMKATGMPDGDGFHTVKVRVYGDEAPCQAPVVAPMFGSVWVPKEGEDVAVIFGNADKPWVIGAWYPLDRVENDEVDLPAYTPGDIRLGNESGAHVTVGDDGSINIVAADGQEVNIGGISMETAVENPLTVPHTEWSSALSSEEIWRVELDSDERLVAYRLGTNFKNGSTSTNFEVDLYDVDTATTLAVATAGSRDRGDPIAMSDYGSTVIARITNGTGNRQIANISSKLAIATE